MTFPDGIQRGMLVRDHHDALNMPVGRGNYGEQGQGVNIFRIEIDNKNSDFLFFQCEYFIPLICGGQDLVLTVCVQNVTEIIHKGQIIVNNKDFRYIRHELYNKFKEKFFQPTFARQVFQGI